MSSHEVVRQMFDQIAHTRGLESYLIGRHRKVSEANLQIPRFIIIRRPYKRYKRSTYHQLTRSSTPQASSAFTLSIASQRPRHIEYSILQRVLAWPILNPSLKTLRSPSTRRSSGSASSTLMVQLSSTDNPAFFRAVVQRCLYGAGNQHGRVL